MRRWHAALAVLMFTACTSLTTPPSNETTFERWRLADSARTEAFVRFNAMLEREGVSDVVPSHELWLVDRLSPECVVEPFTTPPEEVWTHVVPALRFIRDHVEPAIGDVRVVSGYRDEAFNACIRGAPRSAHRGFHALDLVPVDRGVSRADLIKALCPIHAREGVEADIGMGVYSGQRFHIDARGFRGWGVDYRRATFPCDAVQPGQLSSG